MELLLRGRKELRRIRENSFLDSKFSLFMYQTIPVTTDLSFSILDSMVSNLKMNLVSFRYRTEAKQPRLQEGELCNCRKWKPRLSDLSKNIFHFCGCFPSSFSRTAPWLLVRQIQVNINQELFPPYMSDLQCCNCLCFSPGGYQGDY